MKIRLAIIDGDEQYLERIVAAFQNQYADKMEIYSFTSDEAAYENLKDQKVDVWLMAEQFHFDTDRMPENCGFAYFTETAGVDCVEDIFAICKYQKIEYIYKGILGLYAENVGAVANHVGSNTVSVCSFFSINGGAGSSSLAAATALQMAKSGKRTLYLNLEQTGDASLYFQAHGEGNLSELIYLLKSKRGNMTLKIQSIVKQNADGVYFFDSCAQAMDMLELDAGDAEKLVGILQKADLFDVIIIDLGSYMNELVFRMFTISSRIVCVSDGSETSKSKFGKMTEILEVKEQQEEVSILPRIAIAYNKFSNQSGIAVDRGKYPVLGGMPRYDAVNIKQIVERMSALDFIKKTLEV